MRAPGFWFTPPDRPGLLARVLQPLGWLYATGTARRLRQPGYQPKAPVICVGNLTAGGAGKTPTVIALVELLASRGHAVHVVSRGYGGRLAGPVRVGADHTAAEVGDEPLLLSAFAPVWVAKDRAAGVKAAEAAGAGVVLLDDGFQSPAVKPSLGIGVVDAARGFGNGRCIPAGPLREPVAVGLARADLVLTIGDKTALAQFDAVWGRLVRVPRLQGALEPLRMGIDWRDEPVLAFAGIADPSRFFATLRAEGAKVVRGRSSAPVRNPAAAARGRGLGCRGAAGHDRERRRPPAPRLAVQGADAGGKAAGQRLGADGCGPRPAGTEHPMRHVMALVRCRRGRTT
jgi:tetraacyldisaccharide 4'-kinase